MPRKSRSLLFLAIAIIPGIVVVHSGQTRASKEPDISTHLLAGIRPLLNTAELCATPYKSAVTPPLDKYVQQINCTQRTNSLLTPPNREGFERGMRKGARQYHR